MTSIHKPWILIVRPRFWIKIPRTPKECKSSAHWDSTCYQLCFFLFKFLNHYSHSDLATYGEAPAVSVLIISVINFNRFLLPRLQINPVSQEQTIHRRGNALTISPQTLNDAYNAMVDRILSLSDFAKRTLLILCLAYQPLALKVVQHALAVELYTPKLIEENIPCLEVALA